MKKLLFYGGDGRVLKVRYKGQRGEGVYDLVWNGLVDNVERRYKETFSDTAKAEYEQFTVSYTHLDVYKRQNTSCGDQLAKACREAYEAQK